ncbi:MAG TPA: UDP-N-acetylmuramate dehydrogenase [Vicinamibacterales bacterium]|nr:UDP-N-acetylmuramate dehydrogenase [Vicinamibacterales bacterium]
MMERFEAQLRSAVGADRVQRDAPLAPLTTFKVGGPADWLVTVRTRDEAIRVLTIAGDAGLPITILGGGSNVLIADAGLRGLVLRIHGGDVRPLDAGRVEADAGVTINGVVRWTIGRGIAGLEAWAGTPGTVGGAVHGNAHFRGRLISELIDRVTLVGAHGGPAVDVPVEEMEFGYDYSRLHRTKEVVIAAVFKVSAGRADDLRIIARESLAFRKRTQPLESASAGCIFQNPDPSRDRVPDGIPASAGALVDRAGLKDARGGRARVSPTHANFIVNEGGATAAEIRALIERCKQDVHARFGVGLREEIVYLGF